MLYSITNIDICARFSTRYETNHILQWIDHYKMVGVSNIHLYMDVDSSNMSDFAQKNVYDKLMNIETRDSVQHNRAWYCTPRNCIESLYKDGRPKRINMGVGH